MEDGQFPQIMTMVEMRRAVREARRTHLKPASKLGKADLIQELQGYVKKSAPAPAPVSADKPSLREPVVGSLKKEAKESVAKAPTTTKESNPDLKEKRLQALAKAREARKKNLEIKKGAVNADSKPASLDAEKKKSQVQPVKFKYNDLFIY